MTNDIADDPELTKECKLASYHAEKVHTWLDPLFRGCEAAKRAYTFKGRIKTAEDIRNKVLGYRNHEDPKRKKPNYKVPEVTDASGFRIVKLFNAEVPEALDQLLAFLKTPLRPGEKPKVQLTDSRVKEIEFHTSRRLDDALSIYREVEKRVNDQGFKLEPQPRPDADRTASSYSSVHVVVECEVDGELACSEIQLRSVFEEAWGEISHRLRYAPAKLARASAIGPNPSSPLFLHLDALKSLTDGCAQYADLINRELSPTTPPSNRPPQSLDPVERSLELFAQCPPETRNLVQRGYQLRTTAEKVDAPERQVAFQQAADAYKAAIAHFPEPAAGDEGDGAFEEERFLGDVLREELAFCYWSTENKELRGRAEQLYAEIVLRRPHRVSALLSLGRLRRDAGALAEARELLERGLEEAKANPDPDPNVERSTGWLLRFHLAYVCWRLVDLDLAGADGASLLKRAIELSEEALNYAENEADRRDARLNLLYYLTDLWRRSPADQGQQLVERGAILLDEIRPEVDVEHWTTDELDAMVRGEAAFGEKSRAETAAKIVSTRLAERIAAIRKERSCSYALAFAALSLDEQDMYFFAHEIIAAAGNSDKPDEAP